MTDEEAIMLIERDVQQAAYDTLKKYAPVVLGGILLMVSKGYTPEEIVSVVLVARGGEAPLIAPICGLAAMYCRNRSPETTVIRDEPEQEEIDRIQAERLRRKTNGDR